MREVPVMQLQISQKLGILIADTDGWHDTVRHHIEEGSNFLLVLPCKAEAVEDFCHMFGLPTNCSPRAISRSEFFRLSQFMEPEVYDEVLAHWRPGKQVVFVEQLDFPINTPPRTQNFLVYSHVLGIIAQASSMADAKEALADYQHSAPNNVPEATIYCWQKGKWQLYEGR